MILEDGGIFTARNISVLVILLSRVQVLQGEPPN